MKILIVHNDYGRYSGEEAVVDRMAVMFARLGHEVAFFRCTSEGSRDALVGKARAFVSGIYSPSGVKGLRDALLREQPDVVNVHNLYPFISPAALFECKKAGVPVVMTVHNYRLACPTGLFMRHGIPCERCLQRGNEWSCVLHNCEQSWPKSIAYAMRNAVARWSGAYAKCVDRFVCLTDFQKSRLIEAGYDAGKITVIPNSIDVDNDPLSKPGQYVGYLGRLSYEKGYDLLLDVARRLPQVEFRFAGAQREGAEGLSLPPNVRLTGYLRGDELWQFVGDSRFMVIPSRCYEGFPMAILEAAQQLKPVVAPRHGGFTEIVGEGGDAIGCLFQPGSVDSLEQEVLGLWSHPQRCGELGRKAFCKLQRKYATGSVQSEWAVLLYSLSYGKR